MTDTSSRKELTVTEKNSLTHIINGMDVTINSSEKKWNKRRILLYAWWTCT
ncbi:MAG: hypothetical protein IPG99_06315 [Ignavibacteria bacterium]|nr:hypothetical protein [Ignavibacteria bacterium]